jgi:serine O-acetyltransferase
MEMRSTAASKPQGFTTHSRQRRQTRLPLPSLTSRGHSILSAESLWLVSTTLHQHGHSRSARLMKAINFYLHHGLLPVEAVISPDIRLGHHGMGVVIHPNTIIGRRVHIWHAVTIASETPPGSRWAVRIGDDVTIGAGAIIVARGNRDLVVGAGASIGAGAVVTKDVAANTVVVGSPARPLPGWS